MKIIAFGHRRRVGKDTAVKFGIAHLKAKGIRDCGRLSLFDPIKSLCAQIYGWGGLRDGIYYENNPQYKEQVLAPIGKSPRDIWIELGGSINAICPITICEIAFGSLDEGIHLIPDLRRPIEASYVEKFNGSRVKIINPRIPESNDSVDSALKDYDGWTHTLINDGSLKDFVSKVSHLMEQIV